MTDDPLLGPRTADVPAAAPTSPLTDTADDPAPPFPPAFDPLVEPVAALPVGSAAAWSTPSAVTELLAPVQPSTVEVVTCPECGLIATVDLSKRSATDFCRNCDFPLFWAKSTVILASEAATGASLRRLPGTAGQAGRPSVPCPTCNELNMATAVVCIRCGGPMVLPEVVVLPPEPEPEPEPLPEPEPEPQHNWWPVVLVIVSLLAILVLVLLALYT